MDLGVLLESPQESQSSSRMRACTCAFLQSGSSSVTQSAPWIKASMVFPRPVLYATGGLIILDYFPFGSGLASFATYASYSNYSDIYYEYGINRVWGLSPEMPDFICDAFYAELAQFGLLGIMLFIYFWYWVYQKFRPLTKNENFKYVFIVGAAALFFILVECTSSTFFIQTPGVIAMMVIGFVAAIAKEHIVAPIKKPYIIKI